MKQQRYHLHYIYVEKLTQVGLLYGIPNSTQYAVDGQCTCNKMADLMFCGNQITL